MADIPVHRKAGMAWWPWLLLAALVLGALVWLLVAWLNNGDRAPATTQPGAVPANATPATVAPSAILANPRSFYDRPVTTSGEVTDIVSLRALAVAGDLLIVSRQDLRDAQGRPLTTSVYGRDPVRVTGTVREFKLAEIEREIGADLEDDKFTRWLGKPVVVAGSVAAPPAR